MQLRATFERTHGNAALKRQRQEPEIGKAAAQPHSLSLVDAPTVLQMQCLSFDDVKARQAHFLGQQLPPHTAHTTLNAQLTWRYRRCLIRSAKSAVRCSNLAALTMLRHAGWDLPAEQSALLVTAVVAAQPAAAKYLIRHGAQVQDHAALCMEVAAGGTCTHTLQVLLDCRTAAAQPAALRAGLVAAATGGRMGTLGTLLAHIEHVRHSMTEQWRGDVAVALADALRLGCEGGQSDSIQQLLLTPLHPGCGKWHAESLPVAHQEPCRACLWQVRRGLLSAAECGCDAGVGYLLGACQVLAPAGLDLWQAVGEEAAAETLVQAAQRGMYAVVHAMLRRGVHVTLPEAAAAAAAAAASHGQVMALWLLQEHGANALGGGNAPLVQAARGGHWQTLTLLLGAGGVAGQGDWEGLVMAARYNHLRAVRLLLGLPANEGGEQGTAAAAAGGAAEVEGGVAPMPADGTVLQIGAGAAEGTAPVHAPLHQASVAKMRRFVADFRPAGGLLATARKSAALREAAARGHTAMVRLLLQQGADASSVHNQALFHAMAGGHVAVAALLLETRRIRPGQDETTMAQRSPARDAMLQLLQQHTQQK